MKIILVLRIVMKEIYRIVSNPCYHSFKHGYNIGEAHMIDELKKIPLFCDLNELQLKSLENACITKLYKSGTILFQEGEPGTILYFVVFGSVKIFTSNKNGEDKILSILSAGESFGELSLLDGRPRSATAQTVEDTQVISLSSASFRQLLKEHFDISLKVINQLSLRLRETNQQVHDLAYMDAKQRVIKHLLHIAKRNGSREQQLIRFRINLNYDELSQLASVPKATLFQVINELQNRRILKASGNEFLLDLEQARA